MKYTCTYRHVLYIIPIFKPNTTKLSNVQSVHMFASEPLKAVILWYFGFARFQISIDLTNNFFISLKQTPYPERKKMKRNVLGEWYLTIVLTCFDLFLTTFPSFISGKVIRDIFKAAWVFQFQAMSINGYFLVPLFLSEICTQGNQVVETRKISSSNIRIIETTVSGVYSVISLRMQTPDPVERSNACFFDLRMCRLPI